MSSRGSRRLVNAGSASAGRGPHCDWLFGKVRTMKKIVVLMLAACLVTGLTVMAADEKPADSPLKGKVVKVDGTNVVVSTEVGGEKKEVTVATDDKTVVTVDGKDAKLADLKADMDVTITPATGTATKIEATTPAAKT